MFGDWLPGAPRERILIGSSIGAWRMAAACQRDPVRAFARLGELYAGQRYTNTKPSPQQIDEVVRGFLHEFVRGPRGRHRGAPAAPPAPAGRARQGALSAPAHRRAEMRGFAAAALTNFASRARLAGLLERVVIADCRAPANWLRDQFDAFTTHFAPLTGNNLASSLLASGTLPLIMPPVRGIPGAPDGHYWDGGIIDYHLALPYARLEQNEPGAVVLYPHFNEHIVPGWLDKAMPWRRAARGPNRAWLDNVLIVSPSPAFLKTLPNGKLPDRSDFNRYGLDHDARVRAWTTAMREGQRLRDEFADFVANPDPSRLRAI
ncbi:patatin-like phospholipase family protein [Massilia sp. Se16.2.3]|uniref:patatin-like phospholipase family protein n=1 Tax=Massilia sp. Se16.2.3 TaxID=2709303 RepID=UPI001E5598C6|nr:patatin-like phospholipase family protein [Massilia sp. Se16.2.3]